MFDRMARTRVDGLKERLRLRREAMGMSQADLGARLKPPTSYVQISNYESGRRSPSVKALRDLAEALMVSADWLLGLADSAQPLGGAGERVQPPEEFPGSPAPAGASANLGSLQEAFLLADAAGEHHVIHEGKTYVRRRYGWDLLP